MKRKLLSELPGTAPFAALFALATLTTAASAQNVRGRVVDDVTGMPIAAAEIVIADTTGRRITTQVSNADGAFQLLVSRDIDPFHVTVSALGYAEMPWRRVQTGGDGLFLDMRLNPRPIEAEPLRIDVTRRPYHLVESGFYERMRRGIGDFLAPDVLDDIIATKPTDLIRHLASIQVVGDREPIFSRSGNGMMQCTPAIWMDGMLVRRAGDTLIGFDQVVPPPENVEAIELYPGVGAPPEWASWAGRCGVIGIWLKR